MVCTPNRDYWFGFSVQANQASSPYVVGKMVTELSGKGKTLIHSCIPRGTDWRSLSFTLYVDGSGV